MANPKAKITDWGVLKEDKRTVFATWSWTKSHTDHYDLRWEYATGDGHWWRNYDGTNYGTTKNKYSQFTAPTNATKVRFSVRPVSKKYKKNKKDKKETSYFQAEWSTWKTYVFPATAPDKPSAPSVSIDKYKITVSVDNTPNGVEKVEFNIVYNDKKTLVTKKVSVRKKHAELVYNISAGKEYKARCRYYNSKGISSQWSDYSGNEGTIPNASTGIKTLKARSSTSVLIDWYNVKNATSYVVEYTTKKVYFDSSPGEVKSVTVDAVVGHAEINGLESGQTYFFRVKAVNSKGDSGWTKPVSITLGSKPIAPTTWSSTTTAIVGESVILYWVHNTKDGSSQKKAELELTIGGNTNVIPITNSTSEDEKDKTSYYELNTSNYTEGTTVLWRVRTCGITDEYGDWSIQREIDIYAQPTLALDITNSNGTSINTLTSFPFYISAIAEPYTQHPIGYSVIVTANESYETLDSAGNEKMVGRNEEIFSKFYDINEQLFLMITPSDIRLENNIEYTITCSVSMDSGLSAEASSTISVAWEDDIYEPNAEVTIDYTTYSAQIAPYCDDENGNLSNDILLSVYRREFDGKFTEIVKDIPNTRTVNCIDPHPSLDYARYRIVAMSKSTGTISYSDLPGVPIDGKSVVIQWDEEWHTLDIPGGIDDSPSENTWSGSMLMLTYNLDISDSTKPDVELIEYVGRENPVSYYGTQIGSTSTWTVEIPKTDKETLYQLRRLQRWMGDVYVREPSGSGYWANITVSFSRKHCDVKIPVTLSITRVEGGT